MTHQTRLAGGVFAMAALLAALTATAPAGTADLAGRADPFAAAGRALATDHRDAVDAYLDPAGADRPMGWQAIQAAWLQTSEVIAQAAPPSVMIPTAAEAPAQPVTTPTGFAFPEAVARAAAGADTGDVPYKNTALLGLAPGGFGRVIRGQPGKGGEDWVHSGKTALSYIRPNVNVQMMLAFQAAGAGTGGFEGPGFDSRALLSIANRTRVDSAELGTRTDSFGYLAGPPLESDEPQAALAVGLDLGILPTFLSQMGLNVSIVASRGARSGDLTVALVGTTELPVDWIPRERPEQHPTGIGRDPLAGLAGDTFGFQSSTVGGRFRGGEVTPIPPVIPPIPPVIPIVPVIPEPATLALMASALALAALRRRASPKSGPSLPVWVPGR